MRTEHNLVLTGFMGTGKTSVGRELAAMLEMEFVDTDALIEERHGPISEMFETVGEAGFRIAEGQVAAELGERRGLVIATGGRMVLDPENLRALSRHGRIFCLTAAPDEIYRRLRNDKERTDRPLLKVEDPSQRILELMAERDQDYQQFVQVSTDDKSPSEIATTILKLWTAAET